MSHLRKEIESAINRGSAENGSNTPDFVLATFLLSCLAAFDVATRDRDKWYGFESTQPATDAAPSFSAMLSAMSCGHPLRADDALGFGGGRGCWLCENEALRTRLSALEAQLAEAERWREEWQDASGLCVPAEERGGDPGGVRPQHLRSHLADLRAKLSALEAQLAEAKEDMEESDRIADGYHKALGKVQIALDMRCVDDPNKVGCEDTLYRCHEVAASLQARAAEADALARHRSDHGAYDRFESYLARYPTPLAARSEKP